MSAPTPTSLPTARAVWPLWVAFVLLVGTSVVTVLVPALAPPVPERSSASPATAPAPSIPPAPTPGAP